jgi:hypothetical protein
MKFSNEQDKSWFNVLKFHVNRYNRLIAIEGTDEHRLFNPELYPELHSAIESIKKIFPYLTLEAQKKVKRFFFDPEAITPAMVSRIKKLSKQPIDVAQLEELHEIYS